MVGDGGGMIGEIINVFFGKYTKVNGEKMLILHLRNQDL
jgi:hypothetical protein